MRAAAQAAVFAITTNAKEISIRCMEYSKGIGGSPETGLRGVCGFAAQWVMVKNHVPTSGPRGPRPGTAGGGDPGAGGGAGPYSGANT